MGRIEFLAEGEFLMRPVSLARLPQREAKFVVGLWVPGVQSGCLFEFRKPVGRFLDGYQRSAQLFMAGGTVLPDVRRYSKWLNGLFCAVLIQ